MLIVVRNPGQSITIGKDITVTVMRVRGQQVHVGISAPESVPVVRDNAKVLVKAEKAEVKGEVA